jgi:hypothetical protein
MNAAGSAVAGKPVSGSRVSALLLQISADGSKGEWRGFRWPRGIARLFEEQFKTGKSFLTLKGWSPYVTVPRQILAGRASAPFFDETECIASPVDSGRV